MIVVKKKNIIIISVLLITAITFGICFSAISRLSAGEASATGIKIVLDAGHGGVDAGVSGVTTGAKESDLNLAIVKKLEEQFTNAGMAVVLTRSSEAGLYGIATTGLKKKDMQKRKEIIMKAQPDLVISIHLNAYSVSTRRGAQVFFKDNDERSNLLAKSLQTELNKFGASRNYSALKGDYYILNCSPYSSVICECGFLSNPQDEALLVTEEYQQELAYVIFKGVVSYLVQNSLADYNV